MKLKEENKGKIFTRKVGDSTIKLDTNKEVNVNFFSLLPEFADLFESDKPSKKKSKVKEATEYKGVIEDDGINIEEVASKFTEILKDQQSCDCGPGESCDNCL